MSNTINKWNISYRVWHLPHEGDSENLYEDSFSPKFAYQHHSYTDTVRFAVSDGVSGAYFSRVWADFLTLAFIKYGKSFFYTNEILDLAEAWNQEELKKARGKYFDDEEILERLEYKIHNIGGAATFNGLELKLDESKWESFSIGDSCVFQIRNGDIICQNPPLSHDDFGFFPEQIATLSPTSENWSPIITNAEFQNGDIFILATDAVSAWLVTSHDNYDTKHKVHDTLSISSNKDFKDFIARERKLQRMDDDDVTLSIVQITKPREISNICSTCRCLCCPNLSGPRHITW